MKEATVSAIFLGAATASVHIEQFFKPWPSSFHKLVQNLLRLGLILSLCDEPLFLQ
jgi:hypothetical protein